MAKIQGCFKYNSFEYKYEYRSHEYEYEYLSYEYKHKYEYNSHNNGISITP